MSDLPDNWAWSTVGVVADYIQRGKSPKYAETSALPVVNQKCIRWNELQLQHLKYIHPDQIPAWDEARYIRPGDVLWNSTGTGTVGRAYLVRPADCVPAKVVDSHVSIVRAAQGFEPRYLFNWIRSPAVQNKIEEMCDGTTNQIELSRTAIAETAIPVAPREEQTRIADQLDTLLARIKACNDHLDAIPGLLKRFRRAVLAHAVAGRLTEEWRTKQGGSAEYLVSGLWEIPAGWRLASAQDECGFITKGTTPSKDKMQSGQGDIPFIKVYNLGFDGRLDFSIDPTYVGAQTHSEELKRSIALPGDVLMNIVGPPLGKVSVVPNSQPEWNINQAIARFRPGPNLRSDYLAYCLLSSGLVEHAVSQSKATAGQWNLTLEICRALPIPIPPIREQEEIIKAVQACMKAVGAIEVQYMAARSQASRLAPQVLAKAFRGELVQQDPNDEPASVLLQRLAKTSAVTVKAPRGRPRNQPANPSTRLPAAHPDWAGLPSGAWAAGGDTNEHTTTPLIVAVLRAWGQPMPQDQARLAMMLCLQPRLFTAALPAHDASLWRRLVGAEAEPLPASVAALQPAINAPWGRALGGLRARGDVVTSGPGPTDTWSLGPGADRVETAGWPDGRAAWVVAHLRAYGVEAILPLLPTAAVDFVHARAA